MENLLKNLREHKSQENLEEIIKYMNDNPLESYISKLNEIITLLLSERQLPEEQKFQIFTHIINLFISQKIPIEKLLSLSIERLFSTDYSIFTLRDNISRNINKEFLNEYYPLDMEFIQKIFSDENINNEYPVDFLMQNSNNQNSFTLNYWVKGIFKRNNNQNFTIKYKNGNCICSSNYSIKGDENIFRIASFEKFTNDSEWKNDLKEGDEISFPGNNNFYSAIIIDRDNDFISIKLKDQRISDNINKISIFTPFIRKKGEFQKFMKEENKYIDNTGNFNIENFILPEKFSEYDNSIYVIPRELPKKQGNMFFIKIGNYFFRKFFEEFSFEESWKWFNFEKIDYLLVFNEILFNFSKYLNFKVGKNITLKYYDMVLKLLLSCSENINSKYFSKSLNKIKIINFFNQLYIIMSYFLIKEEYDSIFCDFGFQFGLNCYNNSEILEEKILGLNIITICLNEHYNIEDNNECILLKKDPNILTLLFKPNVHSQIIKMSYDILMGLFKHKLISEKEIKQILSYFKGDNEEIKDIIKKVFGNFENKIDNELLVLTIETFLSEINGNNDNDIEILNDMLKKSPKEVFISVSEKVIDKLYSIIINRNESSKFLNDDFNDLIKLNDENESIKYIYLKYIDKLISDMIEPKRSLSVCVQFLSSLLLQTPNFLDNDEDFKQKVIDLLLIKNSLYDIIIDYFDKGNFDKTVLQFLSFAINKTIKGTNEEINIVKKLYKIFLKSEFFREYLIWMNDLIEKDIIESSSLDFLLEDEFFNSIDLQKGIDDELYSFYWGLFLNINNLNDQKYSSISNDDKILTSYSFNQKVYKVNLKEDEIYNPFQMKHFDIIWKMLIHLKEDSFNKNATKFFELFSVEGITVKNRRELWYNLLEKCMEILELNNDILGMRNSINVLKYLIEESETKGTAGLISHIGSLESHNINLSFNNSIFTFHKNYQDINNDENEFNLDLKSNLTIWDLKKILAKKLNIIPECIKFIAYGDIDVTDKDNGKLLSEKFIDGTKINIVKNNILEEIPKVPLIKNNQLTEKAKKTFSEIFDMYSTNGKMSKEQSGNFIYKVTESHNYIGPNNRKVIKLFEKYDYDKDDYLDLEGFYNFFYDAIINDKINTVWDNIKVFDYRNDLKKLNDPIDDFNNDCDYKFMPRYILSNDQKFFDIIFNIQNNENIDEDLKRDANQLINMICTNDKIKNIVINLDKGWEDFLKEENNDYKIFYMLQILESKIDNFKNEKIKNKENKNWIKKFLESKNGFEFFVKEKFLKWNYNNKNVNMKNMIYWCMLKIVLNCLEILFGIRSFFEFFNTGRFFIDKEMINKKNEELINEIFGNIELNNDINNENNEEKNNINNNIDDEKENINIDDNKENEKENIDINILEENKNEIEKENKENLTLKIENKNEEENKKENEEENKIENEEENNKENEEENNKENEEENKKENEEENKKENEEENKKENEEENKKENEEENRRK